jgi:FdhE protein
MPYANSGTARTTSSQWDKRVRRAAELAERFAYAAEILSFYREVLSFQGRIASEVPTSRGAESLRENLRAEEPLRHLPGLLALAEEKGTEKLAEEATQVRAASHEEQIAIVQSLIAGEAQASFFARVLVQPYAEVFAEAVAVDNTKPATAQCPRCGGAPQAAVLRPEGDGGKRFLLCSFCLTEWEFRRILCPVCGEEDYRKLPRYSAEEHQAMHVDACDTCHYYLKAIDLTVDGLAVPLVDEVASVPLDLWASEHGYKKPVPNLMGF